MTTSTTTTSGTVIQPAHDAPSRVPRRAVYFALVAALGRLAFMAAVAGCLLLVLFNAIVDALLYTIAGVLSLF